MICKVVAFVACVTVAQAGFYDYNDYSKAEVSDNYIPEDNGYLSEYYEPQHYTPVQYAPVEKYAAIEEPQEHSHDQHTESKYDFGYSVSDPHTGDHKSQHESREGDVVRGFYTLLQPDGSVRKVEYTADPHHGFQAVVHNTPPINHEHLNSESVKYY